MVRGLLPMIRLIATDLDGTLLNDHSALTPRTVAAVRSAMEAGARFVIASGRMYLSTCPFAQQLDVNAPIIAFNGGMICDWRDGVPSLKSDIPAETARAVCALAEARGVFIQYFPERGFFYERRVPSLCNEYEERINFFGEETGVPLSRWIDKSAMKLLALGDGASLSALREEICARFSGLSVMLSHPTYLEIVSAGVDKGNALQVLCEQLGIAREEVAAFGDADNDLGMLTFAGHGYAMKNAGASLRSRIALHAPTNDKDGVAQVLEELLARGEIGGQA